MSLVSYFVWNILWRCGCYSITKCIYRGYLPIIYRFFCPWEEAQIYSMTSVLLGSGGISKVSHSVWLLIECCYVSYWGL